MKTVLKKLNAIQTELNAPKKQFNSFGKYNYRSCEDILEGAKSLLKKYNCALTVNDELLMIGDRYYVKATAILHDCESGETISNSALAREEESKKGMDSAQVTGATSSYARKYALNGLLAIDDNKDPDTDENKKQQLEGVEQDNKKQNDKESKKIRESLVNDVQIKSVIAELKRTGVKEKQITTRYKIGNLKEMKFEQWKNCMANLEVTPNKKQRDLGL